MNILDEVLTTPEVAQMYGKAESTIKHLCTENRGKPPRLIPGIECRKAGQTWLITRAGIKRIYGEPKKNKKD